MLTPAALSHLAVEASLAVAKRHGLRINSITAYAGDMLLMSDTLPPGCLDVSATAWLADHGGESRVHRGTLDGVVCKVVEYRAVTAGVTT